MSSGAVWSGRGRPPRALLRVLVLVPPLLMVSCVVQAMEDEGTTNRTGTGPSGGLEDTSPSSVVQKMVDDTSASSAISVCPGRYTHIPGRSAPLIPGTKAMHVTDVRKCAKSCSSNHRCLSFQFSKQHQQCKLHPARVPLKRKNEPGFAFCMKFPRELPGAVTVVSDLYGKGKWFKFR